MPPASTPGRVLWTGRLCIHGIVAISLVLLFRMTGSWNLDETGMLYVLSLPARDAFREYTQNLPMLSAYEIFMWVWIRLTGAREFMTRVPSFLCFAGTLVIIYRLVRDLAGAHKTGRNIALTCCLVFAAMPQVQHFATTARAYAPTILLCSLSILAFSRWHATRSDRYLMTSGAWLAAATLTKIFAIIQLAALIPLLWLMDRQTKGSRGFLRRTALLSSLPIIATGIQFPMVLHFQKQSHLHQYNGEVTFFLFRELILNPVFPPALTGLVALILIAWILFKKSPERDHRRILMAATWSAVVAPLILGIGTWITGAFLISEKYVVVAYAPAAILAGVAAAGMTGLPAFAVMTALHLTVAGLMSAFTLSADHEDWRRAFQIARNMEGTTGTEPVRAPFLLLNSGFFETEHTEFEGSAFVEAPARIYLPEARIIQVPDYPRTGMMEWARQKLNQDEILRDQRPILFIAKKPSQKKATLIAGILNRRIAGIEFNQTQVWMMFP